jgi:hypothetical protein
MKLYYLPIALTFLAAFTSESSAQSKQPPDQSKQATQPPASDPRGADQVPLAIKILPATDAKEQAEQAERDRKDKGGTRRKACFRNAADRGLYGTAGALHDLFVLRRNCASGIVRLAISLYAPKHEGRHDSRNRS